MKRIISFLFAVLFIFVFVGCSKVDDNTSSTPDSLVGYLDADESSDDKTESVDSSSEVGFEEQENIPEQSKNESTEESAYSTGTYSVQAENDNYDFFDMLFEDGKLVYVDINDENAYFGLCKGTFGKDAPNHIALSGMEWMTVEDAIKFFEGKGFKVTVNKQ